MANKATLTFAGDTDKLEKAFDRVSSSAEDMSGDVKRHTKSMSDSVERMDDVGEAAGTVDTRAMGFRDTITGLQDLRLGLRGVDEAGRSMSSPERLLMLGMGVGDLASGVENLGAPMIKAAKNWTKGTANMIKANVKAVASNVKSAAMIAKTWLVNSVKATAAVLKQVALQTAAWAKLAVKSLLAAAKVAMAWLISIGPILIVIAIVALVVFLVIKYWDEILAFLGKAYEWLKSATVAAWNFIKDAVMTAVAAYIAYVKFMFNLLLTIVQGAWELIKGAFQMALDGIKAVIEFVWGAIRAFIEFQMNVWKTVITTAWEAIKSSTLAVVETLRSAITTAFGFIKDQVVDHVTRLKTIILNIWGTIKTGIGVQINAIKLVLTTAWNAMKQLTSTVFNSIYTTINSIMLKVRNGIAERVNSIRDMFGRLPGRIRSALSGLGSAISEPFRQGVRGIITAWNSIIGGRGVSVPDWVPKFGGRSFTFPRLHSGGTFHAPEGRNEGFALLRDGEKVTTPSAAPDGGMHITIASDDGDMGQLLVRVLAKAIQNQGGTVEEVLR